MGKILFSGGNGYIGNFFRHTYKDCLIYDRSGGHIQDDIGNIYHHVQKMTDVDTVIHGADLRYLEYSNNNVQFMINKHKRFIDYIEALPNIKQIIFLSSCSVYGRAVGILREDAEVIPTSHYAESKIAVEKHIQQSSIPIKTILRFGTCFGASKNGATRYDTLINSMMAHHKMKTSINIFDPNVYRPYVYINDFADAIGYSMPTFLDGIYNVAGFNYTKQQIVSELNITHRIVDVPDERNYKVSVEKIRGAGYVSFCNLDQGWKQFLQDENL